MKLENAPHKELSAIPDRSYFTDVDLPPILDNATTPIDIKNAPKQAITPT